MKKRIVRRKNNQVTAFSNQVPRLLQQLYAARDVDSDEALDRDLKGLLPFQQLLSMDKVVARLVQALAQQERVLIVGDFDADGATSTALAVTALRCFGFKSVDYLVPNRFEYGYGLTPEIVTLAKTKTPNLIITVDNGIASVDGVEAANAAGIDVIVTDHHLPGNVLPEAAAIVNPNQHGDTFPSKNLAGVGVIFYVMLALRHTLREQQWFDNNNIAEPNLAQFLDLVALGTVADVVTLDRNNRILVHQGLRRIRAGKCRPGILALLKIAKRSPHSITASDLGFAVGPRLNAAGRLEDMSIGIECLLSQHESQASTLAQTLDDLNHKRRDIEADMKTQAYEVLQKLTLEAKGLPVGLCLFDATWHQGVIGILAGRIKEQWHRPVIAFAKMDENTIKGSARSVPGIHIRDVLDVIATQHPGLIDKFGGHAMAAGLSLPINNFKAFSKAFDAEVQRHITPDILEAKVLSDGELPAEEFLLETASLLRDAGPWGQGFPEPLFDGRFRILDQRIVGTNHLKMVLEMPETRKPLDAIAFHIDTNEWPKRNCEFVTAAYKLDINEFRGVKSLQLIISHLEE